jgi:hypothetical protein
MEEEEEEVVRVGVEKDMHDLPTLIASTKMKNSLGSFYPELIPPLLLQKAEEEEVVSNLQILVGSLSLHYRHLHLLQLSRFLQMVQRIEKRVADHPLRYHHLLHH